MSALPEFVDGEWARRATRLLAAERDGVPLAEVEAIFAQLGIGPIVVRPVGVDYRSPCAVRRR